MPEAAAVIQSEPTKIPPPIAAGPQGAAALVDDPTKKIEPVVDDPFEFELDVKGQKQKLKFAGKDQLKAVLQKALYADQIIKDASQAKKGTESLMQKMKAIGQGDVDAFEDLMRDPDIGGDAKKIALAVVQRMMEEEKLTPEQREMREWRTKAEKLEAEKKSREDAETQRVAQEKAQKQAAEMRGEIIEAMKKYPDIPQSQATMDAVIQNMRAAFRRFGKHLSPEQAMSVYSQQYWTSLIGTLEKMEPKTILERFGKKTLDKIQQLKLSELREKTDPAKQKPVGSGEVKKKKHLTEKEFEKHFQELAGL